MFHNYKSIDVRKQAHAALAKFHKILSYFVSLHRRTTN